MINSSNIYYCKELEKIENYEEAVNDKNELWVCHHRMEEVFSKAELIRAGWYYNRRPEELVYIKRSEHNGNPKLHIEIRRSWICKKGRTAWNKGKKLSEETKSKMRGRKFSEEHKKHISAARKKVNIDKSIYGSKVKGKTWKLIDGKRVWLDK